MAPILPPVARSHRRHAAQAAHAAAWLWLTALVLPPALTAQSAQCRNPDSQVAECGASELVAASGNGFSCQAKPFRFVGINVAGLAHFPSAGLDAEVGEHLRKASEMRVRVIRIFLPKLGRSTDDVKASLHSLLVTAQTETPEIKFIVSLSNFYFLGPAYNVVNDDGSHCSDANGGIYPNDDNCFYSRDATGRVTLRPEWFTDGFRLHYKSFVKEIVKEFIDEPADHTWHPGQIFAWELGNELALVPRQGETSLSIDPVETMYTFASEMRDAIRHPDDAAPQRTAPQMVTTGFISLYHATAGSVTTGSGQFSRFYGLFDFATVHGYNNEWATAPATASSATGSAQSGAFYDLEWLADPAHDTPYVFEELGFAGANAPGQCDGETDLFGGVKAFPGGTWPDLPGSPGVYLVPSQEERSRAVRLVLNRSFDDLGADGVMQWAFNRSGHTDLGDLCRGMDDARQFQAAGNPGTNGHRDWDGLFDAYSCRARILASQEACQADLYIQSLDARQNSNGAVHVTVKVRNGGDGPTTAPVRVGLYVGAIGTDPYIDRNGTPPAAVGRSSFILDAGQQVSIDLPAWTPPVTGQITMAAVVNDDGTSAAETDRTCNNGFYQDCRVSFCNPNPAPARSPAVSGASGASVRTAAAPAVLELCLPQLPDLEPTAITYAGASLWAGNAVFFDSGVRNRGSASPGFNVRWLVDGLGVGAEGGHAGVPGNSVVLDGNSQFTWLASEGSHTISFQVDSANTVQESNEANNWRLLTVNVPGAPRPDLKPTAIRYDVQTLVAGRDVTFDSGVANAGAADSGAFAVRWWVDGQEAATAAHPPVAAGATVLDGVLHWTATPGEHIVEMVVDALAEVDEVREDNNSVRVAVTVADTPQPDLAPTAIRYTASQVVPGVIVRFDSGVQNLGAGDAGVFNVRWLVDGQDIGAFGAHAGVPAGATVLDGNSELSWTVLPGRHTLTFIVDADNQWPETNESNNQRTVTVGSATPAVDLTPTAITFPAGSLYAGTQVLFDSGVRNAGTQPSPPFNVLWLVDGSPVGAYGRHVGVAAGTSVLDGNSQFPWTATAGRHTITFMVDADNQVDETNEGNNFRVVTVTVAESARPDLKPTPIRFSAPALVAGNAVLFDAGVANVGAGDSPGFDVRWLVDGQPVGADGFHAGVAAGATVLDGNSQFTWTAQPGTHTVAFLVDFDNGVSEVSELNNRVEVVVAPAAAPLADLRPTAIRISPMSPRAGDTVLFDSGVQNAGAGGTGPFSVRWLVDGQIAAGGFHDGVPAGSTVLNGNSQLSWTARPGAHTVGFYLDTDNAVPESNEGNNLRTVSLVVEGPRLVELQNGDMETHTTAQFGGITGWGPNGGWAFHASFPRPGNDSLGQSFGFYSAGTAETFGQVTDVLIAPGTTYTFKSWAFPGLNALGRLPYQIGYASRSDDLASFVPLATAVVSLDGNTSWIETAGVTYTTGTAGPEIGKQLIVRFGSGADGGFDDIWFDNLTLTVE